MIGGCKVLYEDEKYNIKFKGTGAHDYKRNFN